MTRRVPDPTGDGRELAEARARLPDLVGAPPPLLVVSDFDGTLSPIDPDPMGAVIEPIGRRALRRLAGLAAQRPDRLRVIVLSGRAAIDVARRVRVGGLRYLGNHGLEDGLLPRRVAAERLAVAADVDPQLVAHAAPVRLLGRAVADGLGEPPWLFVELKGPAVAFHYRTAAEPAAARRAILDALDAAQRAVEGLQFDRFEGRRVIELRPAGAGAKGDAVARLLERERPGGALIMGDDRSDAEAFRVVAAARDAGRIAALAVGVHGAAETPPELAAAADLVLPTPRDAARLLAALAASLERESSPGKPPRPEPGRRAPGTGRRTSPGSRPRPAARYRAGAGTAAGRHGGSPRGPGAAS